MKTMKKLVVAVSIGLAIQLVSTVASAGATSDPQVLVDGVTYDLEEAKQLTDYVAAAAPESAKPMEVGDTTRVTLPALAGEAIEASSGSGGPSWSLGLPDGLRPAPLHRDSESVIFQSEDESHRVVTQEIASPQVGTRSYVVIDDATAPTRYEFELDLPRGSSLTLSKEGGVEAIDANGEPIVYVRPPWATDADGNDIPTRFTIDGTTVIQTIEHEGAVYPVVGDPATQHDCGYATCTIRFDRPRTHFIAYSGESVSTIAAMMCAFLGGGGPGVACGVAIAAIGWAVSSNAEDYYNNGNCYGIRYSNGVPAVAWSHQVNAGDYNCEVGPK